MKKEGSEMESDYARFLEIKDKYKVLIVSKDYTQEDVDKNDIVATSRQEYGKNIFTIIKKPNTISDLDLAILLDKGMLNFGYEVYDSFVEIYTE